MAETLTMRTARRHVHSFKSESDELIARHREAMDCRDCEAFLQLGIDAFHWLIKADAEIRTAAPSEPTAIQDDTGDVLPALCKMWLKPCEFAEQWIAEQHQKGYEVENLDEFRSCSDEMRAVVEFCDHPDKSLSGPLEILCDQAVKEHLDGETTEFV